MNLFKTRKKMYLGFLLLGLIGIVGCAANDINDRPLAGDRSDGADETDSQDPLMITTTIGMIADVVANIGQEHVEVEALMGPGVDPHYYIATQGDIRKLEEADIVFYNGLYLEEGMEDILEQLGEQQPVIAVTQHIDKNVLLMDEEDLDEFDPHVWFNVKHWITVAETILESLIEHDEINADAYSANAESYISELAALHEEIIEQIASIPREQRFLVTAHDAFGYFGEAYDIEVIGLQGLNTASEYGAKDVTDLRDFLIENEISTVFLESSVPPRGIEAVIEGARSLGHEIEIGGELFSDAMGEVGTEEGTYIGMIRYNVETIVAALQQ